MACVKTPVAGGEFAVRCEQWADCEYLATDCNCEHCVKVCKETDNLRTCPGCGSILVNTEDSLTQGDETC